MVDAGREEGVLDAQEQQLIHNVFKLDDVRVRQIMTPVSKVLSLHERMKIREVLNRIGEDQYSRYPVLNRAGDRVVGVIYTKDLLTEADLDPEDPVTAFMRPPLLVEPDANGLELYARFRNRQTHFGVVVRPEDGSFIGVVTLEDVLEELFGELRDERDLEEGKPSKP